MAAAGPRALLASAVASRGWREDRAQHVAAGLLQRIFDDASTAAAASSSKRGLGATVSLSVKPTVAVPRPAAETVRVGEATTRATTTASATATGTVPAVAASGPPAERRPSRRRLGGVYLHGQVGSGKTALMDMLAESSAEAGVRCSRMHFHELMLHAHRQINARGRTVDDVGAALAASAELVCLDEMQITDIADAAIVSRLLDGVLSAGATLVTTSNRPPEHLYAGGLNRHVYIPALCATLERQGVLAHSLVAEGGDYRQLSVEASGTSEATAKTLASRFLRSESSDVAATTRAALCAALEVRGGPLAPASLPIGGGRSLKVARANQAGCVLDFDELCEAPLGAADYIALARSCDVLAVEGVPKLTPARHNAARRFVTLVDVWYDQRRELLLSADAPLQAIFEGLNDDELAAAVADTGAATCGNDAVTGTASYESSPATAVHGHGGASSSWSSTFLADGTEWSATGRLGVSLAALSGLQDAAFARRRAASRLTEMLANPAWPGLGASGPTRGGTTAAETRAQQQLHPVDTTQQRQQQQQP